MSQESSAKEEVPLPSLPVRPEDVKTLQEAGRSLAAILPQIGQKFVEEFTAYDKHHTATEEKINRGGRRTSGRILR